MKNALGCGKIGNGGTAALVSAILEDPEKETRLKGVATSVKNALGCGKIDCN